MSKFESYCVKYYKPAQTMYVQMIGQVTDTKFGPKSVVHTEQKVWFEI